MASAPVRIIDRRGTEKSFSSLRQSGNLHTYGATRYTPQRPQLPRHDGEIGIRVSASTRRELMNNGRYLVADVNQVRGLVNEIACYVAGSYTAQFVGDDYEWGLNAERWLEQNDGIIDLRGWPHDARALRMEIIQRALIDGDVGVLLTESINGYPQIQIIPSHRIASDGADEVEGGQYDGFPIHDGVILDQYGRTIAYRVTEGESHRDIPASDLILVTAPFMRRFGRGISPLGLALNDWQDLHRFKEYEKMALWANSATAAVVTREDPDDRGPMSLGLELTGDSMTSKQLHQEFEPIDGGGFYYLRAGANESVEAFTSDRPSANQWNFYEAVTMECFFALGWSYDFSVNQRRIGGAPLRVATDRVAKSVRMYQESMLRPMMRRLDGWRVAKAINLGQLPLSDEWWRWEYRGGMRVTADARYQSDVDTQEYGQGFTTLSSIAADRNTTRSDLLRQRAKDYQDARAIADEQGIPIQQLLPGFTE